MFETLALLLVYNLIWFVPVARKIHTRVKDQRPYWLAFIVALILEFGVLYLVLLAGGTAKSQFWAALSGPFFAAAIGVALYFDAARSFDDKST